MDLKAVLSDIADQLVAIDGSRIPFRNFRAGVGPYSEPQLIRELSRRLNAQRGYEGLVSTKRAHDLLVKGFWAIEFKIVRPFGDNAKQAENWSVNLLHPYPGNVSLIGDCLKLCDLSLSERKAVVAIGYEHTPPQIELAPLVHSFELIATKVLGIRLSQRIEVTRPRLIHPVHQQVTLFAWELVGLSANKTG